MGFRKIELCEHGYILCEDPTSRRLIFERLLVLNVVDLEEELETTSRRMKSFSDRANFIPPRCHQALHPRLTMDPCHTSSHRSEPDGVVLWLSWPLGPGGKYWAPVCSV
ncbi:hypothetical protein MRX96_030899 [Rhipicephalus microplus]